MILNAKCTSQHVEVVPCDTERKVHKSACRGGSV